MLTEPNVMAFNSLNAGSPVFLVLVSKFMISESLEEFHYFGTCTCRYALMKTR